MTPSRRRALRIATLLAVGILLVAFGRTVDWRTVATGVRSADPALLVAALLLNLLSLGLKGVRWWVFLRPLGVTSLPLVLRATFAGASLNNLVVAQGGEGARVLLVSRAAGVSSAGVAAALSLERLLDAMSYLALLVAASWLVVLPESIARWRGAASALLGGAALAVCVLGMVARERTAGGQAGTALPARGRLASYLRRVGREVAQLASPGRLTAAMLLSLAAWALQVATYHLAALAAHLPMPLTGSVVAMLTVGISFLVRATPGNVGVFQLLYAMAVRPFGVAEGPAVAAALLIQMLQVLPVTVVGIISASGFVRRTE